MHEASSVKQAVGPSEEVVILEALPLANSINTLISTLFMRMWACCCSGGASSVGMQKTDILCVWSFKEAHVKRMRHIEAK